MTTFKDIRYLIYSPLELIIGDNHLEYLDTHDELLDKYNDYEVIGIRSATHYRSDYYYESNVVVSLREEVITDSGKLGRVWHETPNLETTSICKSGKLESTSIDKHYENYLENCTYNDKFVCEQCKGE